MKKRDYIGIHTFIDKKIGVEKVSATSIRQAYNQMERNDSSLLVVSEEELDKINRIVGYIEEGEIELV